MFSKAQLKPSEVASRGSSMKVKAKCTRLAERSVVVGNTAFSFNKEGVCEVEFVGRASAGFDFDLLLKMNGVSKVVEAAAKVEKIEEAFSSLEREDEEAEALSFVVDKNQPLEVEEAPKEPVKNKKESKGKSKKTRKSKEK